MEHKAFIIYNSHAKLIQRLSAEEAGQLFFAIVKYNQTGEISDLSVSAGIIFDIMKEDFDRDRQKYEKRCAVNAENGAKAKEYGSKGGRPRKNPPTEETPKNPERGFEEPQSGLNETPKTPKDKDKDKDKDKSLIDTSVSITDVQVSEEKEYGNQDINKMLGFLKQSVGCDDFKESSLKQRQYARHFLNLGKKLGQAEFLQRLEGILEDGFKSKNCHKLSYLYGEMKAYIHSPVIEKTPTKVSPNVF